MAPVRGCSTDNSSLTELFWSVPRLNGTGQLAVKYRQFTVCACCDSAFRDNDGKPWVLPVVAKVEVQMAQGIADKTLNHEYLGIDGLRLFSDAASEFLLGKDSSAIAENRVSANNPYF